MSGMTRVKSGAFKARKGIPKDVRDDYRALFGVGWEELFRAPAGCPLHRARVLHSEWEAEDRWPHSSTTGQAAGRGT
jgi:hypothetical protein